jgi:hypothetical protein
MNECKNHMYLFMVVYSSRFANIAYSGEHERPFW